MIQRSAAKESTKVTAGGIRPTTQLKTSRLGMQSKDDNTASFCNDTSSNASGPGALDGDYSAFQKKHSRVNTTQFFNQGQMAKIIEGPSTTT